MADDLIERAVHASWKVGSGDVSDVLRDLIAALRAKDAEREELATLVRMLAWKLKRVAGNERPDATEAAHRATEYLRRKGLAGNWMREGESIDAELKP